VTTDRPIEGHRLGVGPLIEPIDDMTAAFVRHHVERGTAIHPPADGKLPPGVTHLIVGETEDGAPILQRARFSAY
jgi:hypothetical protein